MSFDQKGEVVQTELLDLKAYRSVTTELDLHPNDATSFSSMTSFDFGIGEVVGKLVELGGKWLQGELEKEAERYKQQFSNSAFEDGFWTANTSTPSGGMQQRIVAIRVRRYTNTFPQSNPKNPAFEFLAALKVSGDKNFLVVYPLYLKVQSTKAKIVGERLDTEIQLEQTGHWLDSGGILKTSTLAVAKKTVSVQIGAPAWTWNQANQGPALTWSPLVAPPISANAPKDTDTGMLNILVTVTETDQSKAAEWLKKGAKFVEEKTPEISAAVRARVEKALGETDSASKPAPTTNH
jgi:hypothetical protein